MLSIQTPDVSPIRVRCEEGGGRDAARRCAAALSVEVNDPAPQATYELVFGGEGVYLAPVDRRRHGPISVDFTGGALAHRRRYGGGNGQLIAKAAGLKGSCKPQIIDATAGLGGDAFILASLGASVDMMERSPVAAALLQDGLARAQLTADEELQSILQRMHFVSGDACTLLQALDAPPQVIYLDPMFPDRAKSAASGKSMQAFAEVIGEDPDAPRLLAAALATDAARVVVKRPRHAPTIEGPPPNLVLTGKSGRFDVYARRKLC